MRGRLGRGWGWGCGGGYGRSEFGIEIGFVPLHARERLSHGAEESSARIAPCESFVLELSAESEGFEWAVLGDEFRETEVSGEGRVGGGEGVRGEAEGGREGVFGGGEGVGEEGLEVLRDRGGSRVICAYKVLARVEEEERKNAPPKQRPRIRRASRSLPSSSFQTLCIPQA